MKNALAILRHCDIQPTPQRLAVVKYVMHTTAHPSAEEVLKNVRRKCPTISRATVYNTLNLLVEKGLLKSPVLHEGAASFDANLDRHHHFIDEESGRIYDIPWEALRISGEKVLAGYEIREYQIIVKGRKKRKP